MLLKYINSNRISVIIFIIFIPLAFWIPSLFQDVSHQLAATKGVPLGRWIIVFNQNYRVLASLIALLLVLLNGYLLIQLNAVHIFIPIRTQLPLYFYIILSISITQLHQLTPALVSSTLMILVFYRIFRAYKIDGISINFLDAGLLISVTSLIYFPAIVFFLFLITGMILLRPFIWREWVFAIIGILLPYAFVYSACYIWDIPAGELFNGTSSSFLKISDNLRLSQIVNWSYVLFIMLLASYNLANAIDTMKIHARKFFLIFFAFFMVSVLIYFVFKGSGAGMVYYVAVPLAYLFSYYFVKCKRNWMNELFFAIFLLLLIWQRIN